MPNTRKKNIFIFGYNDQRKGGKNIIWKDHYKHFHHIQNIFEGLLIPQKTQVLRTESLPMISRYFY